MKTVYSKIKFPEGVACEKLSSFKGRKKLKTKCPEKVQKLLDEKGAQEEYNKFVDDLCAARGGWAGGWKSEVIDLVIKDSLIAFEVKGIRVFGCRVDEYVSTGQGGYVKNTRWLEFVDIEKLPDYKPARGEIGETEEKCVLL
mmetsp:Transcript_15387/g.33055  ORF Transcript_15387/g.33055 Transcript_15387/m.33055 type:complete len:142 (-) Transcript_15387:113-538(-)